jgi:hypothetical protein
MKRADLIKAILHYDKTCGVSTSLGTSIPPILTDAAEIMVNHTASKGIAYSILY